jgi:carboxylesterase type B
MSEDCLRLNVWTPADRHRAAAGHGLVHGGGQRTGSGNSIFYDGASSRESTMWSSSRRRIG